MTQVPPMPRLPLILLGLLTLGTFGGPVLMLVVVRGGPSAGWPPDRTVEWVVIAVVMTLVVSLFIACVTIGLWYPWPHRDRRRPGR